MKVIAKSCTQNLIQNARVLVIKIKKKKKKLQGRSVVKATTTLRRCELSIDKTENESAPPWTSFILAFPPKSAPFFKTYTLKNSLSLSLSGAITILKVDLIDC